MERFFPRGRKGRARLGQIVFISSLVAALCGGCTRAELESKAEAYNAAIATSTNELILLNAVRASQRAPMSFTGLGDITATPALSGSVSGTANFDPFGLTTWLVNPSVAVNGGFSQYTMSNLNRDKFMNRIRDAVDPKLIRYFVTLGWPEELMELMFIGSFVNVTHEALYRIESAANAKCAVRSEERTRRICEFLDQQQAELAAAGCGRYAEGPKILNTGRDICGMATFQILLRRLRLLNFHPLDQKPFAYIPRSPQGILYYLGELIAAQNYSPKPYMPMIYIGTSEGRKLVPLFVVRRGLAPPGWAAVRVHYEGEPFYIPRPELGSIDEARSMQVLDFVSQVITAQTSGDDLPKANALPVIQVH